jgi:acyl-coenzyme A synthetase/AMP-(fatty) acid ligase
MAGASSNFAAADTAADDVCLIGFTSGTTGQAKGTMHFHRDLLAICDCFPPDVLQASPDDIFIGSPPLAFTFGLGGLVLFPFRIGATAVLLERAGPRRPPPRHRQVQSHRLLHRPDRLSRHARQAPGQRHLVFGEMCLGRRDAAHGHLACVV